MKNYKKRKSRINEVKMKSHFLAYFTFGKRQKVKVPMIVAIKIKSQNAFLK